MRKQLLFEEIFRNCDSECGHIAKFSFQNGSWLEKFESKIGIFKALFLSKVYTLWNIEKILKHRLFITLIT